MTLNAAAVCMASSTLLNAEWQRSVPGSATAFICCNNESVDLCGVDRMQDGERGFAD